MKRLSAIITLVGLFFTHIPSVSAGSIKETGGTNFNTFDLGAYATTKNDTTWSQVKIVLTHYHENPSLVRAQLQNHCNSGQKKLGVVLWFMENGSDSGTANSSLGKPSAKIESNIRNYLTDVSNIKDTTGKQCFNELFFRFAPIGNANPSLWTSWQETIYQHNQDFIFNTRQIVKQVTDNKIKVTFDLGVEQGGLSDTHSVKYTTRLWSEYVARYGTSDTYGFSIAWVKGALTNLLSVYKYTNKYPNEHAIDVYEVGGQTFSNFISDVKQELSIAEQLTKPIIIQETFFADQTAYQSLQTAIDQGINIRTILQWQVTRTDFFRPDGKYAHFSTIAPTFIYFGQDFPTAPPPPSLYPTNLSVLETTITWTPGAITNPQYLRVGTDQAAVKAGCQNGVGESTGCVFKSDALPSIQSTFTLPTTLSPGTTYYWRIANSDGTTMRDAMISSTYQPTISPSPSPVPGDLTGDGKVNLADFNKLIMGFGNPYTLYDFNLLVANFGT